MANLSTRTRKVLVGAACVGALGSVGFGLSQAADAEAANTPAVAGRAAAAKNECAQTQGCDLAALQSRIDGFAPSQPVQAGTQWITRDQAITASRKAASNERVDKRQLPAQAEQLSYGEAVKRFGQAPDPLIDLSRPVWVVTVQGERTDVGIPAKVAMREITVYTEVIDAATGALISEGLGVDAFAR